MKLSKWHALGNDYLLVERAELVDPLTPDRVRQLCDYHYGAGSNGLLEVLSASCASGIRTGRRPSCPETARGSLRRGSRAGQRPSE